MKVTCLQENLAKGLSVVSRAVATRSTLDITKNVLISTDNSRLKLAATNLEIALSCWIGAKVEEEGSITIPNRILTPLVDTLPNDRMELALSPRTRQVKIECGRTHTTVSGMDAEDFPSIPTVAGDTRIALNPQALKKAIAQVVFAAATDDSRPVLTGVHMLVEGERLTMAAADGFRLAVYHLPLAEPVSERLEVVVPARAVSELGRLLGDGDEPVEMLVNAGRSSVMFRLPSIEMVAQLLQGAFPNYGQLIPQSYASRAVVSVAEFLRVMRTAAIFSREGSGIVRLYVSPGQDLSPGQLRIQAKADESGDNESELDASVDGDESKIAFNSRYLQDVLGVLEGQVALEITSPSAPGVLRPVGMDNYVHVIMPMFVQW
jgi:DNA polymerase III subunit beta